MTAKSVATITAICAVLATSAGAYVVRNFEHDVGEGSRLTRVETIVEINSTNLANLVVQVRELTNSTVRLTALVEDLAKRR